MFINIHKASYYSLAPVTRVYIAISMFLTDNFFLVGAQVVTDFPVRPRPRKIKIVQYSILGDVEIQHYREEGDEG